MTPHGPSSQATDTIQYAYAYAQLGLPPVPIPPREKGPRYVGWQQLTPESGYTAVVGFVQRKPDCNLGIVAGTTFFALDFDVKPDPLHPGIVVNGFENFVGWANSRGYPLDFLQGTCHATTGGGGSHFLFAMPPGATIPSKTDYLGIKGFDVRATGGQIVVAPSVHPNGRVYRWDVPPWQRAPAPAPDWLLAEFDAWNQVERLAPKHRDATGTKKNGTPSREIFEEMISKISRKRSTPYETERAKLVLKLMRGEPIAEDGGGHDAFLGVTDLLGRKWMHADPQALLSYVQPGIDARIELGRKTSMSDIARMLDGAQRKAQETARQHDLTWRSDLDVSEEGQVKNTEANAILTLREHEDWHGVLAYNTRTKRVMVMRQPPLKEPPGATYPRPLRDSDSAGTQIWFQTSEGLHPRPTTTWNALVHAAEARSFDPIEQWFRGLYGTWDGRARVERWLHDYMGAQQTPLHAEFGKRWLLSAVARTMARPHPNKNMRGGPGCKVDSVLVAEGPQGIGKSRSFRALLPEHLQISGYTDHLSPISSKDARLDIHGPLIVELSELQAIRRVKEQEDIKAFISTPVDAFRAPYGRVKEEHPRTTVFCATTNDRTPFRDPTGARRFWPFEVRRACDPEGLAVVRDQLWAEVLVMYFDRGDIWWLPDAAEEAARLVQQEYTEEAALEGKIEAWLAGQIGKRKDLVFVTTDEILLHALDVHDASEQTRLLNQLKIAMEALKWRKTRIRVDENRFLRGWIRPGVDRDRVKDQALMHYHGR